MAGNDKKTLIVLTPGFPKNEADSTCLPFIQRVIISLNRNFPSLQIVIIAFQYPYIAGTYEWNSNTVISLGGNNKGKLYRIALWLRAWKTLKQLNRLHDIIGMLCFWCTECALVGKMFSKRYGLKNYIWLQGQDAKQENKYVKYIRPQPDELIALSDFLQDTFNKNYGIKPLHIIPIGVDTTLFEQTASYRTIDVLGAGSLIPLKQYDIFVEVIAALHYHLSKINALICGKGPEKEKLADLISVLKLQNNITLTDEISHSEVLKKMQQTKVFLHTSNYEGFGAVCLEAICAGAHVISFVKPMKGTINNWYIVNNKEEMIQKALELLSSETNYQPTPVTTTDEIAKRLMQLYL